MPLLGKAAHVADGSKANIASPALRATLQLPNSTMLQDRWL